MFPFPAFLLVNQDVWSWQLWVLSYPRVAFPCPWEERHFWAFPPPVSPSTFWLCAFQFLGCDSRWRGGKHELMILLVWRLWRQDLKNTKNFGTKVLSISSLNTIFPILPKTLYIYIIFIYFPSSFFPSHASNHRKKWFPFWDETFHHPGIRGETPWGEEAGCAELLRSGDFLFEHLYVASCLEGWGVEGVGSIHIHIYIYTHTVTLFWHKPKDHFISQKVGLWTHSWMQRLQFFVPPPELPLLRSFP